MSYALGKYIIMYPPCCDSHRPHSRQIINIRLRGQFETFKPERAFVSLNCTKGLTCKPDEDLCG